MKLWQYIKGPRKGKEAHQIEQEAMRDPFLADALEGYEKIPGNHQKEVARIQKEITKLQKRITNKTTEKKINHLKIWGIAASILLVAGVGTWFVLNIPQQNQGYTMNNQPSMPKTVSDTMTTTEQEVVSPATGTSAKAEAPIVLPAEPTSTVSEQTSDMSDVASTTFTAQPEIVNVEEIPVAALSRSIKTDTVKPDTPVTTPEQKENVIASSPNPQPVAGMEAYNGYLQRNLKHPTDEECSNVKGNVVVVFKIGQSGRPYNIRVEQGLCTSINKEAIRLIINGPDWKKGTNSDEAKVTITF